MNLGHYITPQLYHTTLVWFLSIFSLVSAYYAWKKLKKIRLLQDTPFSKIHAAAQGYLQLAGHGEHMPGAPIKAPRSGVDCLWYEYKLEQQSSNDEVTYWTVLQHQVSDDCFYIKDSTGVCVVNPDGAYIIPTRKSVTYERPSRFGGSGWFSSGRLRHTEITIDVGAPLIVIGEFQTIRQADHELTIEDEVGELIRSWKQDYHALLEKYDTDGNGELDPQEWQQVLADAEQEVLDGRQDEAHTTGIHVIAHPRYRKKKPFIIAGRDEKILLRGYWWRFWGLCFLTICTSYYPFTQIFKSIL